MMGPHGFDKHSIVFSKIDNYSFKLPTGRHHTPQSAVLQADLHGERQNAFYTILIYNITGV